MMTSDPDLSLQAASLFVRQIYDALGKDQPPLDAIVDLESLALEVYGQIEELKVALEALERRCP
jgi:hypothetical protein